MNFECLDIRFVRQKSSGELMINKSNGTGAINNEVFDVFVLRNRVSNYY
jgi:hypothetical protein